MSEDFQQRLGAWQDDHDGTGAPSGDWRKLDAVSAGTCAVMETDGGLLPNTGGERHLLLLTGTWVPSSSISVSIQSHVYEVLRGYCDADTPLYVVDKDKREPHVYRYELGDFSPSQCAICPPPKNEPTITHDQHTRALSEARAEYRELNDGQREFIRSVKGEVPMRLSV